MKHLIFSGVISVENCTMSTKKTSCDSSQLPKNDKNVIRLLTVKLRKELKNPQGLLIEGPFEKTMNSLKELIEKEKPSIIISVGDIVTQNMIDFGLFMNVIIIDNKTMRKPIEPIKMTTDHTIYAKNPPGSITEESWAAIRWAFKQDGQTKVVIEGEEDLLALVTVLSAPEDALVVYGQPNIGIVVVKVDEKARKKMENIVYSMKETSKS